jgi:Na+/melibiose symporter-like transporter
MSLAIHSPTLAVGIFSRFVCLHGKTLRTLIAWFGMRLVVCVWWWVRMVGLRTRFLMHMHMCAHAGLLLMKKIGKRNTWLTWSLTMAVTNSLFYGIGDGDVTAVIVIAGINGIPMGAKFISDAILADVIDYDEFLTGARSEATYTMFKSFLPKIAAIPASAVPVALLGVRDCAIPAFSTYNSSQPTGVQNKGRVLGLHCLYPTMHHPTSSVCVKIVGLW